MCVHCKHELGPMDLLPVVSWVLLRGKCRYCHKPIDDTPLTEIVTAALFVVSYLFWPESFHGAGYGLFVLWLVLLVVFVALAVYDLRWFLLPNRLVFPLYGVAAVFVLLRSYILHHPSMIPGALLGMLVGGGFFYLLFQLSDGKWIGGGDVKLGGLLGLLLGGPVQAFLCIILASLSGTIVATPLLLTGKASRRSRLPFGPLLIFGAIVTMLFGARILAWYNHQFLSY